MVGVRSQEADFTVPNMAEVQAEARAVDTHAVLTLGVDEEPAVSRPAVALAPMALLLAWPEAVELDSSCDVDHAGLVFAGGEVAGLLGGPGAGSVGVVPDEELGVEDFEQEGGQRQVKVVRGENPP
jgi:hypothetical protein